MDKRKVGSIWVLIIGILIIILGLIHNAATSIVFHMGSFEKLPKEDGLVFIYMYVATGTAVIAAGLLTIYCSFALKKSERMAWTITIAVCIFMILLGIGAIITMTDNPFAYIMLVLPLLEIIPLLNYKNEFIKGSNKE